MLLGTRPPAVLSIDTPCAVLVDIPSVSIVSTKSAVAVLMKRPASCPPTNRLFPAPSASSP
eukprot:32041-Eustigmatos_ZCMA.PRE.1